MPPAARHGQSGGKLVIGKVFGTASQAKMKQDSAKSIKCIVGQLSHSRKVYLLTTRGDDPLTQDLKVIGDTLKVSFAWHLVGNGSTKISNTDIPKHGMLEVFFNGTTVDIYGIGGIPTGEAVESLPRVQDFQLKMNALREWSKQVRQLQNKLERNSKEMAKKKSHKKNKSSKKRPSESGRAR